MTSLPFQRRFLPFFMWLFPLLFFAYQFILRIWPSLMMSQIMTQFSIDATQFGFLASLYYYGYSGMQIPIAIALEKVGIQYVLGACTILCGVASLFFNTTDEWVVACISRFLVGAGSAVGFLGCSKVISEWFPKDRYARMVGFTFTIGLLGAIYGGKPITILVESYGWQKIAFALTLLSLALGTTTYLFLRSPENTRASSPSVPFKLSHFKTVLTSPALGCLAAANLLMVGVLEGFADVWGVPYLMTAHSLSKSNAAELISFIFIGMIFGGPLLGLLSKKLGTYGVISLCGTGMALVFFYLLLSPETHWYKLAILFFLMGVMCCYQVIVFAAGADLVNPGLLGITVAFLNCINMLGGSFFHTVIGTLMDTFWTGARGADGLKIYTLESYQSALCVIPLCTLIGAIITGFLGIKLRKDKAQFL